MIISRETGNRSYNNCKCDICGIEFKRRSDYKSFENCKDCSNNVGASKRRTHGHNNGNSKLHVTWNNMISRCHNKNNRKYPEYGGRGIFVCDQWRYYESFMSWSMNNGYSDGMTIDRIDNDTGYNPQNCRFTDVSTQNANKRISSKNKSGYIGVDFNKGSYRSKIQWMGKQINLGRFKTAMDAAKARDEYIIENNLPHTLSKEIE